jgi:outer membrane protein
MINNRNISILVLTLLVSVSTFAQGKKWTLTECVSHAVENNITVKRAQNTLLINDQDIKAAKGQFLPGVSGSVGQSLGLGNTEIFPGQFIDRSSNSTNISVGANYTVFNGFRRTNLYKQSLLIKETNDLELSRIRDNISLNVVNSYLNILFNKERLETAKAQYAFTEKQLQQVKDLVDAGVQPRANIYDAEATLSNDSQSVTVAENNYNLALLTLSQLLQVPYEGFNVEIINIDSPSASIMYNDIKPILDYAFANRGEIKVAEKNIENSILNTEISKAGLLPTVSLGYGYSTGAFFTNLSSNESPFLTQLNDQRAHSFNLSVNIPIFSRFSNKTAVARSKIQEENSKLALDEAKLALESNIQRSFTDAQAALKTYEAATKSLEAQELSFGNAQERYNIGAMNAFELEQARIRLINAESSLINAKYDFVFKTKVLDFYLGKPITQ